MLLLPAFVGVPEVNRVYHVEALTLLKAMGDASVDVIMSDLPYNVGKAQWDYLFPTHWVNEGWRVSKRMLIMSGNSELINAGQAIGRYRDCIVMHARNGMTRSKISFGNWFPVLACGDWEWEARPNYLPFNVSITEKIDHPSPKPLSAMLKLIEKYTKPDWLICDPFMGSGTTAIAAQQLGRRFIGCDISREYVEVARKRLAQPFTLPMLLETAS